MLRLILPIVLIATLPALAGKAPVTVTIDAAAKKQTAVPFPHEKHSKVAKTCDLCHHDQKGLTANSKAEVKKCSACHLDAKSKAPSMSEMSLTKNPFHKLCISCHKEQKKGPTVCAKCHVKKA
jgi:predicted CXXCH cytochrome family protein